jgi:hypothetical protein
LNLLFDGDDVYVQLQQHDGHGDDDERLLHFRQQAIPLDIGN